MTIHHHPSDDLLTAYATGLFAGAYRAAVATHVHACAQCRGWVAALEYVGGEILETLPPADLAQDALSRTLGRLGPSDSGKSAPNRPLAASELPSLPPVLRRRVTGSWRRIAPGLQLRALAGPDAAGARVLLLRGRPGTRLLPHSHRGVEMSCVLRGGFTHGGGHFGPGDFDVGDETSVHRVTVDPGEDCVALVVLEGKLRLTGLFGRVIEPFLRL